MQNGNFDFPAASDRHTNIGNLTQRFEGLRQTLRYERDQTYMEQTNSSAARERRTPPTVPRRRRMASVRAPTSSATIYSPRSPVSASPAYPTREGARDLRLPNPTRDEPARDPRLILGARPANRHLRRLRQETREDTHLVEELRDRREQLERIGNHLNETENSFRDYESSTSRRRMNKRRKLDHDGDVGVLEPYGYYGQTVPGHLKMEIVSCDGGEYSSRDPRSMHLENYRAENVLREDGTVYCTKSSRCNLMLRQRGEALFHLDSLVIAAPKRGFTAPVQEGLVFVGMTPEKLTATTTSYSIQYSEATPPSRSSTPEERAHPADYERLSLIDAVNDDQIWQTRSSRATTQRPRSPLRARAFPNYPTLPSMRSPLSVDEDPNNYNLDNCDYPALEPSNPPSGLTRAPTPPPFTVTTVSTSDTSSDTDSPYGQLPPLWRDLIESDTDDQERRLNSLRGPAPARRESPGMMERVEVEREVEMEPNARFFMPKNDCRITVKFHPPVAGRFILLKLFSPQLRDGENIDIEYVAAHGFSGPRFFPSVEPK